MSACLSYLHLWPSKELQKKLDPIGKRYDIAVRLTILATTVIALLGLAFLGLACGLKVHPFIGCGLLIGSVALFLVATAISSAHGHYYQKRYNKPLNHLYHPPKPPDQKAEKEPSKLSDNNRSLNPIAHQPNESAEV